MKKIYDFNDLQVLQSKLKDIKKEIYLVSLIFVIISIIVSVFFVHLSKIYLVITISISVLYSLYLITTLLIRRGRLVSYVHLLHSINSGRKEEVLVKIYKKTDGLKSIFNLNFTEYYCTLVEDVRKERIINIEESCEQLKVGCTYQCILSSTLLVEYKEVEEDENRQ